jgi:ribosomal subunit interface protein
MQVSISGKHLDVGDALRSHATGMLASVVERHFGAAVEGKAVFAKARHLFRCDISVHVARGLVVQSHGEAVDPYDALSAALARLETRLGRYKGRLVERRKAAERDEAPIVEGRSYVLDAEAIAADDGGAEDHDAGAPAIVAETVAAVSLLSLREAVLHMDLADQQVLLFRNRSHGGYNVVHRRTDGSIGWIDAGPLPSA